mmetsp:Transcript_84168/g.234669  ORF Transcript_84168/g.234669 Transcript_84168/m.234669 type:complete len:274 (+) Transcript_84168:2196-3017(+)
MPDLAAWVLLLHCHTLAVHAELYGAHLIAAEIPYAFEFNLRRCACGRKNFNLLTDLHAISESWRRQPWHLVRVLELVLPIRFPNSWIEDRRDHVLVAEGGGLETVPEVLREFHARLLEVGRFHRRPRPAWEARLALQDGVQHDRGEAVVRRSEPALRHVNRAPGPTHLLQLLRVFQNLGLHVGQHELKGDVADDLGRRRDFDDVAAEQVNLMIHLDALLPTMHDADRLALRVQVGVLASGDLVVEDARGPGEHAALVDAVELPDPHPVVVQRL